MGTHPIFESDFDCLTERKMSSVMPQTAATGFGLADPARNTAARARHPVELVDTRSIVEKHDLQMALKNQGRGFALGLRMEATMMKKPRFPGSAFRSLGAETLADRHTSIAPSDFLGEVHGAETLTTFNYPM